ncbi:MAG: GNAT family N-acetyltransferase [Planctomycetota bacterium]|jgi:FemAB-related protein (PEP-CTERM system-associated)|nr:GNAT family N-acetyltransferase [Planctomycetota bacterium]MDP6762100.1 GNAT family N-acetyltransferase [Planctomycetota bacterium]MDP6989089.1 GNAT family N-acetyltransferase [Planctomycetota bacterium]
MNIRVDPAYPPDPSSPEPCYPSAPGVRRPARPDPWGARGEAAPGEAGPGELVIRTSRAGDDRERDEFVRSHPSSALFHLSGWSRAVEGALGAQARDLVALEDGRVVGVLPLTSCRRVLGGRSWISAPWGVYGGPLAESPRISERLVAEALEQAARAGVGRVELRCREDLGLANLIPSDLYVTYRKPLPERADEVLNTFPRTERKALRRAVGRDGLWVEEGHHLRGDLARLFLSSKRSLGSPGLPERWWEALETELGDAFVLHAARRGDELLAVSLSFLHRDELAMYYIGTTPEANRRFHATTFLIAACMEWGVRHGYRTFDLGRSRKDSGACVFKANQGFDATPLHYCYALLDAAAALPSFHPSNPRTALLRRTWARLPLWACHALSERLAIFLP